MYEAEIKILDIDRPRTEARLVGLGARKIFEGELHALYWERGAHELRDAGITLRLRREGDNSVVTLKSQVNDPAAKVRDEREVFVSDFGTMKEILISLGYRVWLEISKIRTTYEIGSVHFALDRHFGAYGDIPEFLEIEAGDVETLWHYAALLGFAKEECRPWDITQVAEHYSVLQKRT